MIKKKTIAPFLTAVFIPLYPMLYLYNKANNSQYLSLLQVLLVSVIFMLGTAIFYLITKRITKSPYATLLFCMVFWVFFFSNDVFWKLLAYGFLYGQVVLFYFIAFIMLYVGIYFLSKKLNLWAMSTFISLWLAILLVYNSGLAAYRYFSLGNGEDIELKTTFGVDDTLPTPNVYWFHCDGMLGFDAMEKYFGDSQEYFTQKLIARGFAINREAQFEAAHNTSVALPVLMNPYFYDSYLSQNFENRSVAKLLVARMHNELVLAFNERDYHSAIIGELGIHTFPISDDFYDISISNKKVYKYKSLSENALTIVANDRGKQLFYLLMDASTISRVWPLINIDAIFLSVYAPDEQSREVLNPSIDASAILDSTDIGQQYVNMVYSLDDALNAPEPRFSLVMYNMAHSPFIYDENGKKHDYDAEDISNYPSQHTYAAKVLINLIDMVLDRDPDAVIVLQADHGLHTQSEKQIMAGLSCAKEDVLDIWNGVMSAVRIPAQYGAPEESLHPLNITRYLVNHYIGENYPYLDE